MVTGKPCNKLLFYWRLGMPAVVSATPAYAKVMGECGLPMACSTSEEWRETLEKYCNDENAREEAGRRGKEFVEKKYNEHQMLERWDGLMNSLF